MICAGNVVETLRFGGEGESSGGVGGEVDPVGGIEKCTNATQVLPAQVMEEEGGGGGGVPVAAGLIMLNEIAAETNAIAAGLNAIAEELNTNA